MIKKPFMIYRKKNMNQFSQLVLFEENENLNNNQKYAKEKYIVTDCNQSIAYYLFNCDLFKDGKIILLHGPEFSGKTHLCNIVFNSYSNAIIINAQKLDLITNLEILKDFQYLILDQAELFLHHHINKLMEYISKNENKFLLISMQTSFLKNDLDLELQKKIFSVTNLNLNAVVIDEYFLTAVITKILLDYEIQLNLKLMKYISQNIERSFEAIQRITNQIKEFVYQNSFSQLNLKIIKKFLNY